MKKIILGVVLLTISISLSAQKFSAPSQGYFSNASSVKIMMEDSSAVEMSYNLNAEDPEIIPEVFYLVTSGGDSIEVEPNEILSIEIGRGDEPISEDEVIEEEDEEDEYEYINVLETDYKSESLIYERVKVDHKKGVPLKSKYREDSYLLQLASVGMGDRLKVYHCPNFKEDASEVAPLGEELDEVSRNREDYIAYQNYYFIKVADQPAFRISRKEFINLTPAIFGDCRPFRRKYGVKRTMDKERTKKRKKTSRSKVGKKKKKASYMKYQDLNKLILDYHVLWQVQLENDEAKRLEREKKKKG